MQQSEKYTSNNKRIAKNTLMLYVRQMVVIAVGLYTVRIVLEVLGIEDYGVYNVVGGIVAMLSFLSGTMASATQRFFSFYLGRKDTEKLQQVFSVNIIIYLLLIGVVCFLLETAGLWFVSNHLEIPQGREEAVRFIFQFSILTFVVNMLSSPFIAIINAHEDMQIFAYASIVDAVLKLSVVFILQYINFDKLEYYGVLLFIASAITTIIYISICLKKYQECQFKKIYWNKETFKEMLNFTSWATFGSLTSVMREQAITILINQYFSPITVAARVIASQVAGQLNTFSSNFNASLYPPIIKSYSNGNLDEMYELIYRGSKITFFLMWVLVLPIWVYMEQVLELWLKDVPQNVVLFTRLALIEVLIQSISTPVMTAARAPGKMRLYELTLGTMQIALFFTAWFVFSLGYPDYSVYLVIIVVNIAMFGTRLLIVRRLTGLPLRKFITDVALRMGGVAIVSIFVFLALWHLFPKSLMCVVIVGIIGTILNCLTMLYCGFNKAERSMIINMVKSKIKR